MCIYFTDTSWTIETSLSGEEPDFSGPNNDIKSLGMRSVVKLAKQSVPKLFKWHAPCPRLVLLITKGIYIIRDLYFPVELVSARKRKIWINLPICNHAKLYWFVLDYPQNSLGINSLHQTTLTEWHWTYSGALKVYQVSAAGSVFEVLLEVLWCW